MAKITFEQAKELFIQLAKDAIADTTEDVVFSMELEGSEIDFLAEFLNLDFIRAWNDGTLQDYADDIAD